MSSGNLALPNILYAGCLDSDPFFSLKECDRIIVSGLKERGVGVRELHKELPQGKGFRTLNRNLLYPAAVSGITKNGTVFYQRGTEAQSKENSLRLPSSSDKRSAENEQSEIQPGGKKLLHISSQCYAHLIPKAQCPVSITCHDVAEFEYPEDYSHRQLARWHQRISYLKDADLVFSISEFTKQELINKAGIPSDRIVVNHNGVDPAFRVLDESEVLKGMELLGTGNWGLGKGESTTSANLRGRFKVLVTGSNIYRKNLPTGLRAVEELARRGVPVTLVKTGDPVPQNLVPSAQCLKVINLGFVSKIELVHLYNLCDVFAFPSLYEGFGLPVVEAQKCGLPCVISNAASLPEVGGDGALYHDPEDAGQLADQLQRIYEDQQLKSELREKGFVNASRFLWDKHIEILITEIERRC